MKRHFKIILFIAVTLTYSACKKGDWRNNPALLAGSYRLNIIADTLGVPPQPFVTTIYTDTIMVTVPTSGSYPLVIDGNPVNQVSEGDGTISYQWYHTSGTTIYTFWNGGDSISFQQSEPPTVVPNNWTGRGAKI